MLLLLAVQCCLLFGGVVIAGLCLRALGVGHVVRAVLFYDNVGV